MFFCRSDGFSQQFHIPNHFCGDFGRLHRFVEIRKVNVARVAFGIAIHCGRIGVEAVELAGGHDQTFHAVTVEVIFVKLVAATLLVKPSPIRKFETQIVPFGLPAIVKNEGGKSSTVGGIRIKIRRHNGWLVIVGTPRMLFDDPRLSHIECQRNENLSWIDN